MSVLVNLIVMLGMLVVVPAGLRLIDADGLAPIRRTWPLFVVPGAVALWLPRSTAAAVLAAVYALGTLVLALQAPRRLVRTRSLAPAEIAVLTALVTPSVASLALIAERSGHELFGFSLPILALTVPHFHYAGFAAALIAGLVCRTVPGPLATLAAWSVPAGTGLVFAGYFVNDATELAGAVVLTAGMWLVGWLTWRDVRPLASHPWTRWAFGIAAVVLVLTMLLALDWALGHVYDVPHLSLTWMAATHGAGNALGFGLCGMLAWRQLCGGSDHGSSPVPRLEAR